MKKQHDCSIGIVVPAYNAGAHLPGVIKRIPESFWKRIQALWIINDGSTDNTGRVSEQLAAQDGTIIPICFEHNRGYGEVVRKGLALCRDSGCTIAVCLHGDGQYAPEVLPQIIEKMESESIDILQGSRMASGTALAGGMPLYKFYAGRMLTALENRVFGLRLTDYHSGYLAYSRQAFERIQIDSLSKSFDFDLEVIASACSLKLSIAEIPIPARYAGEVSYLNPVTYGLRVLRVLWRYLNGRYRT